MQSIYPLKEFILVYVIGIDGAPRMPCSNAIARILLKEHKAKVKTRLPFTIKLNYAPETAYTQPLVHGVDTGSGVVGSAVVNEKGVVVYQAEVELRNDIAKKMQRRLKCRRGRRHRNTRYRPARFDNRANSTKEGRLPPTVRSKIDSHLKEIGFVRSILPITKMVLETASFDPHALKNPEVLVNKALYQKGVNYGFANAKAYVLHRDGHECQHCKGKSKSTRLQVHHIIYRSNGGSDDEKNLLTLCDVCHAGVHANTIKLKAQGKRKTQLKHATQMNVIRSQLLQRVPNAEQTFGFITKEHRQWLGLDKSHANDAIAIAHQAASPVVNTSQLLIKRCVAKGDYQQTKGVRSEQRIPTGKIEGWRKFDKVEYKKNTYYIQGRMSSGYAVLMNENFEPVKLKPIPKFCLMKRIAARKSWIIAQKTTASIS